MFPTSRCNPTCGLPTSSRNRPNSRGRHQKALLGAAVFAADADPGTPRVLGEALDTFDRARIDLVVRHFGCDEAGHHQDGIGFEQRRDGDLPFEVAKRLFADLRVAGRDREVPVERVRDIRHDQAGVLDASQEIRHLRVGGGGLQPGIGAKPQLDAVKARLLDELEPPFQAPALREHVVANRFLHVQYLHDDANPAGAGGAIIERPCHASY